MKSALSLFVGLAGALSFLPSAVAQAAPTLKVQSELPAGIRLSYEASVEFQLEEADNVLGPWSPLAASVVPAGGVLELHLPVEARTRFYRLGQAPFTTIVETSPYDGEQDVAVTRESFVRFSAPLAENVLLTTNRFYATFGGRRILSRVELGSDRTKASLFYLEPLPGSARIHVVFDGSGLTDSAGRPLDAANQGSGGGSKVFEFDTLSLTPLAGTAIIGRVFASELQPGLQSVNRPLPGVTITVDGQEQNLRTTTDAQGNFKLEPVPPGRFFVHIDGRTAAGSQYPSGDYYPTVGKQWEAEPGRRDNLAGGTGEIYLPLIRAGTLQPVSETRDTSITFTPEVLQQNPALAGVSITVPANSLFSDSGVRGGRVGIAPVPPDRLPGPLPPGLELPMVITVQTDGALNFDKPVPICFPNFTNALTGRLWPPGTKGELISFNHKKGVWESVGGMTVNPEGTFFCTDPGVGILQPGWHGPQCPKPKRPKPKPRPKPDDCHPDSEALTQCLHDCEAAHEDCDRIADIIFDDDSSQCRLADNSEASLLDFMRCNAKARDDRDKRKRNCTAQERACKDGCKQCNGTPLLQTQQSDSSAARSPWRTPRSGLSLQSPSDAATEQAIRSLYDQVGELVAPYANGETQVSLAAAQKVMELLASADAIAGGSAAAFLEQREIAFERSRAAVLDDPRRSQGNEPDHPLLYAATVIRPSGTLILRGRTEPGGDYSLFVPPDGKLRSVQFYDPSTRRYAETFPFFRPEAPYDLPRTYLADLTADAKDSDADGLADVVEFVYGTDPTQADTDGDGLPDGAEIENGTDPLGGRIVQTGVIATAKTPGAAVDVAVWNDWVVTADGSAGLSVFNAYSGLNPTIVAQLPLPGEASRVAVSGGRAVVAEGDAGIGIVDLRSPSSPKTTAQLSRFIGAQAVAAAGDFGFVGLSSGQIVMLDLTSGALLSEATLPVPVRDLTVQGDYLYALSEAQVFTLSFAEQRLALQNTVASPFTAGPNRRLFAGVSTLFVVHGQGFNTFDLAAPSQPRLLRAGQTSQYGWRHLVVTGSGAGVAAVGPNSVDDSLHDVSLYDVSNVTNNAAVVTTFPTPGSAESVAIWNGLAYVADRDAGLQVVNYLPYDTQRKPPRVRLLPGFSSTPAQVREGEPVWLLVDTQDDVQVRKVELYLNDFLIGIDGCFPFELRFETPLVAEVGTSFRLRAKSIDTGGNEAWSDELVVALLPDTRAPRVTSVSPTGVQAQVQAVSATFSKAMASATFSTESVRVAAAGGDGSLGTADDFFVAGGALTVSSDARTATLSWPSALPPGLYQVVLGTEIADRGGHPLAAAVTNVFQVGDFSVFWLAPQGGDWAEPTNWSTGRLPQPSDRVWIRTLDGAPVTHASGRDSVRSLLSDAPLLMTGGSLSAEESLQVNERLSFSNGATLANTTVMPGAGPNASVRIAWGVFDQVRLRSDGAIDAKGVLFVPNRLSVDGTLTVGEGGALFFDGLGTAGVDAALDGRGRVALQGSSVLDASIRTRQATLTIESGLTIGGVGAVAVNTNFAAIVADRASGRLSVSGNGALLLNRGSLMVGEGGSMTVAGQWRNEGQLHVREGELVFAGATVTAGLEKIDRVGGSIKVTGTIDNSEATLALNRTTGSWVLASGTLLNGRVTFSEGASLEIPASGTFDGVTLESDLTLSRAVTLNVPSHLTINGRLTLVEGATLFFDGLGSGNAQTTLDGAGEVLLQGSAGYPASIRPRNTTITVGGALTIRGGGATVELGGNRGHIEADGANLILTVGGNGFVNQGTISVQAGSIATLFGAWRNQGTIRVMGGELNLGGTVTTESATRLDRTGGVVKVTGVLDNTEATLALNAATGSWILAGGTVKNGRLTCSEGVALEIPTYGVLDGVTLESDLSLNRAAVANIPSRLTVNAKLSLAEGASLFFDGLGAGFVDATLDGKGEVVLQGSAGYAASIRSRNASIRVGAGLKIHGGGATLDLVGNQGLIVADTPGAGLYVGSAAFVNQGTLEVQTGSLLTLDGQWRNEGRIKVSGGNLKLQGSFSTRGLGAIDRTGGSVTLVGILDNAEATLALNDATGSWSLGGGRIIGGSISMEGAGDLQVASGSVLDGVSLDGNLSLPAGVTLTILDHLVVNRTLTFGAGGESRLRFNGTSKPGETMSLGGTGQIVFPGGADSNYIEAWGAPLSIGSGFTLRGASGFIGSSDQPLTNSGTIICDQPGGLLTLRGNPVGNLGSLQELNGGRVRINP